MANTEEGRKLTEAHRKKQIVLGEQTERRVKALAKYVNEEDISGSWRWRLEVQRVTEDGFNRSRDYAATYVDEYSLAETGWREDIRLPVYDRAKTDEAITVLGVAGIKAGIRSGSPYRRAVAKACSRLAAHCGQLALAGGRNLIDITVKYSGRAGGYRRVTDGKPCAFCAMLASRGPVYSEETAFFESHHHCGCSAEIVYGDWVPSDEEADWAAVYKAAAGMADDAGEYRLASVRKEFKERDTILWRMRRISPQLFSDGVGRQLANEPFRQVKGAELFLYKGVLRDRNLIEKKKLKPRPKIADLTIAPASEPYKYFTGSDKINIRTAEWLEEHNMPIRSVKRRENLKTPDATNMAATHTIEVKTASSKNAIHSQIRYGREQSSRIVLDLRNSELTKSDAKTALSSALYDYGLSLDSVLLIVDERSSLVWLR